MKKIIYILVSGLMLQTLPSCDKWLDVNPKSQVKGDQLFKDESGFKTAMFGVYSTMNGPTLYGENLTMTYFDAMVRYYDISSQFHANYQMMNFNYTDQTSETLIKNIWTEGYKAIMNCNNLLENIEGRQSLFANKNYHIIRGEILGLRAYMHLDLLRMFAPSFAVDANAAAIPYVDKVVRSPFPQLKNSEVVARIIADCKEALNELAQSDPIVTGNAQSTDDFLANRQQRMNYYAVKALMARAYLWSGNKSEAALMASDVIKAEKFGSADVVFGLYLDVMKDYSNAHFLHDSPVSTILPITQSRFEDVYETTKYRAYDRRCDATWIVLDPNTIEDAQKSGRYLVTKYLNMKQVPMIRMAEMYYILAECGATQKESIDRLNKSRQIFGIPESLNLSADADFNSELAKEYRKTFLAEGQLFFFYKRKDFTAIPNVSGVTLRKIYALPLPTAEFEFGNLIKQ